MEVMIVKNNTIAKILLGTFVLPSFMAVATPIYAAPGEDDKMSEQTTQSSPAPVSVANQPPEDGNLLLATMNETEKEQIRSYLENHISRDGVLDLSQVPTLEMPKFRDEMFNLLERRNSPVRNVRLSYKHLYDIMVKEAISNRDLRVQMYNEPDPQMKVVGLWGGSTCGVTYQWKIQSSWFYDILTNIGSRDVSLSFDYIMPFAPDPYDTSGNSVLNLMDVYRWIISKHKLENTNSLLVYTTPTFTASDWIKNTSGVRRAEGFLRKRNFRRCGEALKCVFENDNPMYAEFTGKSPLENVVIFSTSPSVNQDVQILKDFFGREFNYNREILISNQLNPTNTGFDTSVFPINTDRVKTRLEPVYLHNVFLYAQNCDINNAPLQRNFNSVCKNSIIALQQLKTMNIEQFINLTPETLRLVSGLETIVVNSHGLNSLCFNSPRSIEFLKKLSDNIDILNEIKKQNQKDTTIRILIDIRYDKAFVRGDNYEFLDAAVPSKLISILRSKEFIEIQFDSLVMDLRDRTLDELFRMATAQNLPLKHLTFTGYDRGVTDSGDFRQKIDDILGGPNEIKRILNRSFTKVEFCGPHFAVPEVARMLLGPNVSYLYNNVWYLPRPGFDHQRIMTTPSDN